MNRSLALTRYFALVGLLFSHSHAQAQALIPIPVSSPTTEVSEANLQCGGSFVITGTDPSIQIDGDPGSCGSGSTSILIQSSGNQVSHLFTWDVTLDVPYDPAFSLQSRQMLAIEVPDVGTPTTTILIKAAIGICEGEPGFTGTLMGRQFARYELGVIGLVEDSRSLQLQLNDDPEETDPQASSLLLVGVPDRTLTIDWSASGSVGIPGQGSSSGSCEHRVEVFAVPEPGISLLQGGAGLTLAALMARARE